MRLYFLWCILLGQLSLSSRAYSYEQLGGTVSGSVNRLHDSSENVSSAYSRLSAFSSALNSSVSCEDLQGVGSFNTTCLLNSNLYLDSDIYVYGTGNLEILPHVSIVCPLEGCMITFNLSGNVKVGKDAAIVAGSIIFTTANMTLEQGSSINTTSLGGLPPSQTSGTPVGHDGAGGGHGGRGASCLKNNHTNNWGGDVYAWSTLNKPWSYGSKGGGTSATDKYGGNGGGRVMILVKDLLNLNGSVLAEGGDGGLKGGGSGGSIFVRAIKL